MNNQTTNANDEKKVLNWHDFPSERPDWNDSDASTIAAYLRRLLEKYEESEFIKYLIAPSPTALSGFFHCEEEAIYQALQELERQGYETETCGNAGPITLWDPLIRRKTVRHQEPNAWQLFYDMLIHPPGNSVAS